MFNRFVTLTYHRVTARPDALRPNQCCGSVFALQLAALKKYFNVLPLSRALPLMDAGRLPARSVCISFDDGYRDNYDVALPLLKKAGLPATFFVTTGYLGSGIMWNDRIIEAVRARPAGTWELDHLNAGKLKLGDHASRIDAAVHLIDRLKYLSFDERDAVARSLVEDAGIDMLPRMMMTRDEVAGLEEAGMEIGAHTVSHPILTRITATEAHEEISTGRDVLREFVKGPVSHFAYPNGKPGRDFDVSHDALVRDLGFEAAFSTAWGYASRQSELFRLPRIGFETDTGWRFVAKLTRAFWEKEPIAASPGARFVT